MVRGLMCFLSLVASVAWAKDDVSYVMPQELVRYAERVGCEQVVDFFSIVETNYPPFVYGVLDGLPGNDVFQSAAFWCRGKESRNEYWLMIMVLDDFKDLLKCKNRVIAVDTYLGGLSVTRGAWNLAEFSDVETGKKFEARRIFRGRAIYSLTEAYGDIFICHGGRWLRSRLH